MSAGLRAAPDTLSSLWRTARCSLAGNVVDCTPHTCSRCRSNSAGQLGVEGEQQRDCEIPAPVEGIEDVVDVRCGESHTVALTGRWRRCGLRGW